MRDPARVATRRGATAGARDAADPDPRRQRQSGAGHGSPSRGPGRGLPRPALLQRHFLGRFAGCAARGVDQRSRFARRANRHRSREEDRLRVLRLGHGAAHRGLAPRSRLRAAADRRHGRSRRAAAAPAGFGLRAELRRPQVADGRRGRDGAAAESEERRRRRGARRGVPERRGHLSRPHLGRRGREGRPHRRRALRARLGTAHGRAHELDVQERRRVARRHRRAHRSRGSAPESAAQSLADAG